jgi:GT2 family glycosyltransferase
MKQGKSNTGYGAAATLLEHGQYLGSGRERQVTLVRTVAAICTRNRGASLISAVETILASDREDFSLIIVDQSSDDTTADALAPILSEYADTGRVRYIRTTTAGAGRARNIALREAACLGAEFVLFTDDDCTVPPEWVATMVRILEDNPRVAVAFCNVAAAPHDRTKGFIPAYERSYDLRADRFYQKCVAGGIGAGMAVRRRAVEAIGGFDDLLGPGGRFPSHEDGDIAARALLTGWEVYETCEVSVVHFGYRTHQQGRQLAWRDWQGVGGSYAKPLKAGRWEFAGVILHELMVKACLPLLGDLLHLRRPRGFARIRAFVAGFVGGWRLAVDPKTLRYLPTAGDGIAPTASKAADSHHKPGRNRGL